MLDRVPVQALAGRFHRTIVECSLALVRHAAGRYGRLPVVLSGGCFQNRELSEDLVRELTVEGHIPWLPRQVPPGDGGICLGQVLVAGTAS
jgi:hydrogenase maturation protein HypF